MLCLKSLLSPRLCNALVQHTRCLPLWWRWFHLLKWKWCHIPRHEDGDVEGPRPTELFLSLSELSALHFHILFECECTYLCSQNTQLKYIKVRDLRHATNLQKQFTFTLINVIASAVSDVTMHQLSFFNRFCLLITWNPNGPKDAWGVLSELTD